jgi:hypothetical protein
VTSAQTATFAALAITIMAVFLLVIIGVPLVARLLYRKRMEVIRDDLVDAILDDKLRETRAVQHLLTAVEASLQAPRRLTLLRIFAIAQAAIDSGTDIEAATRRPRYSDLVPAERELVQELDDRLCRAFTSYMDWGSPSALYLKPLLALTARIRHGGDIEKAENAMPAVARETLRVEVAQHSPPVPSHFLLEGRRHPRSAS